MFIVLLKFSAHRDAAGEHMDGHKAWLQRGFEDGVFLLAGSLRPAAGGVILAHGCTQTALEARVNADPFVMHGVVSAECMEVAPSRADEQLSFLLA
jgi:uncharacterized protein YciI